MRWLGVAVALFVLVSGGIVAQNVLVPTRAPGDNTNAAASTAFVQQAISPFANSITGLTGDVSASGPGNVSATIQPAAVTNAKLANMAAGAIKCNPTPGSAAAQDCAPSLIIPGGTSVINFGASGSGQNTTGTIATTSTSLSLTSVLDFANGQGIRINHAGAAFTLGQPTGGAAAPQGTAGGTTYQYQIASLDGAGGVGAATATFQTITGNATLGPVNYNQITWNAPGGTTPTAYAIYRNISGTFTLIGVTAHTTFYDYGFTSYPFLDWVPSIAPGASLSDWLVTSIVSGGGSATLVLNNAAGTTATTQGVFHDDTAALQNALGTSGSYFLPVGTYYTTGSLTTAAKVYITGAPQQSVIRNVVPGSSIIQFNDQVGMNGIDFLIVSAQSAIAYPNTHTIGIFQNIHCHGGAQGVLVPDEGQCVGVASNSGILNFEDIFLDSWTTGGVSGIPPTIRIFGTSLVGTVAGNITLDHINHFNDGSAVLEQSGAVITLSNVFNSNLTNFDLNGNTTTLGAFAYGLQIEGGSQAVNVRGGQVLNFGINARIDSFGGNSPITTNFTNNHFDSCKIACLELNSGSGALILGNSFIGEALPNNFAIFIGSSFSGTTAPNVISDNTINGFSGSGSTGISVSAAIANTTIAGNNAANMGANALLSGAGTASAQGVTCPTGSPSASFATFQGIVIHC